MIGRSVRQDLGRGILDPIGKFGAKTSYEPDVAIAYRRASTIAAPGWTTLHASNKKSEHNVHNVLPRLVVYQSPPMTKPAGISRLVSRRPILGPGNQNLGGT